MERVRNPLEQAIPWLLARATAVSCQQLTDCYTTRDRVTLRRRQ
jgi:hypothetical protein